MSQSNLSPAAQEAATDTILDIDLNVQAEKGPDLRKDHPKSHGLPNWVGNRDTRRNVSRVYLFLGNGFISWMSKKQPTITLSSTKAKYRALTYINNM